MSVPTQILLYYIKVIGMLRVFYNPINNHQIPNAICLGIGTYIYYQIFVIDLKYIPIIVYGYINLSATVLC